MTAWTPDTAEAELRRLAERTRELVRVRRHSAEHVRWVAQVRAVLSETVGEQSPYYASFTALPWSRTGSFIVGGVRDPEGSMDPQAAVDRVHQRAYIQQLDSARGLLEAAADEIARKGLPVARVTNLPPVAPRESPEDVSPVRSPAGGIEQLEAALLRQKVLSGALLVVLVALLAALPLATGRVDAMSAKWYLRGAIYLPLATAAGVWAWLDPKRRGYSVGAILFGVVLQGVLQAFAP